MCEDSYILAKSKKLLLRSVEYEQHEMDLLRKSCGAISFVTDLSGLSISGLNSNTTISRKFNARTFVAI
jgi:hypothetical protein